MKWHKLYSLNTASQNGMKPVVIKVELPLRLSWLLKVKPVTFSNQ